MSSEQQDRVAHLARIRARAETQMAEIGVDAAFIDLLVETFYARIRVHPTLGPVFAARLDGRWPQHLDKMKRFWSALAFKSGAYGGKPAQAHTGVDGITEPLFLDWLALFAATLHEIGPTSEAKIWFMTSAERIARSLVASLFHSPAAEAPADDAAS